MGNKEGKQTPEQELNDEETELLQDNTNADRNRTIEWEKGFFKVYLIIFKLLYCKMRCFF